MHGDGTGGTGCSRAVGTLLRFYARELDLDRLLELAAHLADCASCADLFNAHGRQFGLIVTDFGEFLDPDREAARALPHPIVPLVRPIDVVMAGQVARLHLMEKAPAVRFRGGGRAVANASRATFPDVSIQIGWTAEEPPQLVVSATGEGASLTRAAVVEWSDGSSTPVGLSPGGSVTVPVPAGLELARVVLE